MQSKAGSTFNFDKLINKTNQLNNHYKPILFNLKNIKDQQELAEILTNRPDVQVFDHIQSQVKELIKCLNPSNPFSSPAELEGLAADKLGNQPEEYGIWVYYPWSEKLVHLLDEEEFSIVRTNRNKHKITNEEQLILSKKKIGVMGLSVGQSVSLTLAIERGFGELRIADFDELDLSNLNRIRTGIHNLKLKKTVIVAREIAEIDPFLKVNCFHEGITDENIDQFLTGNGQLDLLIDECDSFDVKISAREKAKKLGIPVLMEGSDRCTIDIERFDLEPDRPVLHGFVENMDMKKFKTLKTLDEKLPYIAPVTGVETLSPRMKASAIEMMTSISTWPQLASAVTYGGGITADLARKILLNHLSISGRFFIDLDELITDEIPANTVDENMPLKPFSTVEMGAYLADHKLDTEIAGDSISPDTINKLISSANKAPSGGNNQPWIWHYQNHTLHLFLNKAASGAYLDPDYISSYISLGAAIENLLLEASVNHLEVTWQLTPELFPDHIAFFNFKKDYAPDEFEKSLAARISQRHTNRKIGIKHEPADKDLEKLKSAIENTDDLSLTWLTNADKIRALGDISGQADLLRMFIPAAHEDFIKKEMRWDLDETALTEDGIGIHALDLSNNDQIGLRLMKDRKAVEFLKKINGGSAFKRLSLRQFESSSAIGLITSPASSPLNYLKGGIAAEKLWLNATEMGYQIHPVNVPLIFFYKNSLGQSNLSEEEKIKISILHQNFKKIFEITDNIAEIFLFRLFKAEPSAERTIRKPINKNLSFGTAKNAY